MPYNCMLHISAQQSHHSEPLLQKFRDICTVHRQNANILFMFLVYLRVYTFANKVPDAGSDVLEHVAHYCVVLECFV